MTSILGLNAYHGDAAAALVIDGELVGAAEEERFARVNHVAGFPARSARWCLAEAGLRVSDLDHVAVSRDPRANIGAKLMRTVRHGASARYLKDRLQNAAKVRDVRAALAAATDADPQELTPALHHVEHHHAHAASAFFLSPFDDAAIASIDGFGDFASFLSAVGRDNSIDTLDRVLFPHSLGMFYTALTQWLGFVEYGDEGKVMGLAPYGRPELQLKAMRDVVRPSGDLFELNLDYFVHDKEGVDMTWDGGSPRIGPIYSEKLLETFGAARQPGEPITEHHQDVAAALQKRLEEIYLHLLTRLYERTRLPRLCLAGGVALNAVANGLILSDTPFEEVYVQGAAGDSGTALGAAYWVWNQQLRRPRPAPLRHLYHGPAYEDDEIEAAIRGANVAAERVSDGDLYPRIATSLAEGAVVGWFQGRMEFGPRALGNRSILADPRRADMKEVLNTRIKRRETFRPFAPSILAVRVDEWFEQGRLSPFMALVYRLRPEAAQRVPAVTHVDGSGRVQTVTRETSPQFHRLLAEFERLTGVPVLLNTSFNENEPIVMRPADALDTFAETQMDVLVLGNYVVRRSA